jgi:hypothetical protein
MEPAWFPALSPKGRPHLALLRRRVVCIWTVATDKKSKRVSLESDTPLRKQLLIKRRQSWQAQWQPEQRVTAWRSRSHADAYCRRFEHRCQPRDEYRR